MLPSFNSKVVVGARYEGTASESAGVPMGGHSNKSSCLNVVDLARYNMKAMIIMNFPNILVCYT